MQCGDKCLNGCVRLVDSKELLSSRHQQVTRLLPRGLDQLYLAIRWMRPRTISFMVNRHRTDASTSTYKDAHYIHGLSEETAQLNSSHHISSYLDLISDSRAP